MKYFGKLINWIDDLLWLVFPEFCTACNKSLSVGEKCLCTSCPLHLPKTNFHLENENKVAHLFWGKTSVQSAASFYHFRKSEKVQHMIHLFKYKNRKDIGLFIGELYGHELKQATSFADVDLIIPVPLHKKKERKRGYNQSELFARGLATTLGAPVELRALKREIHTGSQTLKRRYQRFLNMEKVFSVSQPEMLNGKHILLVDDVVTTGSTLTACAEAIQLSCTNTKVSIATIAAT